MMVDTLGRMLYSDYVMKFTIGDEISALGMDTGQREKDREMQPSKRLAIRSKLIAALLATTMACALGLLPQRPAFATTFTVTNTNDSGAGSLRQAVTDANNNSGADIIEFNISGCSGVCTIQLASTITLVDPAGVTIDGYSQPGAAEATGSTPATILIELDGSLTSGIAALSVYSNNTIQGLDINQFYIGISMGGPTSGDNLIRGCYLGTDPGGTLDRGNTGYGIALSNETSGNTIGGTVAADRNLISGNDIAGVTVDSSSTGNTISGNYIGTTADGLSALGNTNSGVQFNSLAHANTVGGSSAGARNLISGNTYDGITINGGSTDPNANTIEGNWIGLDATGASALANGQNGVQILNGAYSNTIGPNNVISGNVGPGVDIWTGGTNGNHVEGNFIGTDSTGTAAVPNASIYGAIYIHDAAQGNVIGGNTATKRNVISGNTGYGIRISGAGTDLTVVSGNYIGLDVDGISPLLNGHEGVAIINNAASTTVGGDTSGEGNVIASNYAAVGINTGANNNTVSGNLLGTDASGKVGMGGGTGVALGSGAHDNTVGGATLAERNVISGNGGYGVGINGSGTDNNQVLGNYIGVDITGTGALPNGTSSGMRISNSAQSNTIGPNNIIANHATEGIYIYGADTDFNIITQNSIHSNTSWNIAIAADGANEGIPAPTINSASLGPTSVSGTSCNGCTVEVFTSPSSSPPAGKTFLGSGVAGAGGNWTISIPGLHGPYLTATATDATMGTSAFSTAFYTSIVSLYMPLITNQ